MRAVSETIAMEGNLLIISLLFGMLLMLGYDVLRIFRRMVKHGAFLMAVEDGIYWLACAIGIFAMLYQENDGLLRWFVLAGVALGMLMENSWFSPWIIKISVKILSAILGVWNRIWNILGKPVKKVSSFFQKQLKKIKKAINIGISKM
ncbi:MAG: spore cortex biosynthesis protein YabQ [Lachnospiraceae bacterium]|nr:spore cortex biosynthesis protein YabQ [Lachnospiraceae bacterium]